MLKYLLIIFLLISSSVLHAQEKSCYQFKGLSDPAILKNVQTILKLDANSCTNIPNAKLNITDIRNKIQQAVEPFGYFHSDMDMNTDNQLISVNIHLNQPARYSDINISIHGAGQYNPTILQYLNRFPIKQNEVFTTEKYEAVKTDLYKIIRNEGYLKASFANKILINRARNTVVLEFKVITGEQYFFGDAYFTHDIYSTCFLKRMINFKPYEPFSAKKLNDLQQQMEKSAYFQNVVMTPDFDQTHERHVPIKIAYEVPKARAYMFGIGYGTLSGAHLNAAMSLRRLNSAAHYFESNLQLSSIVTALSANYFMPGKNPLINEWRIGTKVSTFNPDSGQSKSATIGGGYAIKKLPVSQFYDVNFLMERFQINGLPTYTSHALYPSLKFNYLHADNVVRPETGYAANFTLIAGSERLFSTTSFLQGKLGGKLYLSPFSFARIIMRGDLGYSTIKDLPKFPFSLRFFAGGVSSIRGFADSSIGPGRYLGVASIEYQNKIVNDLFAAVFLDEGKATNHFHTPINKGAGMGIIYYSIVGPIKIYVARAISKRTQPYDVTFSMGPEFA